MNQKGFAELIAILVIAVVALSLIGFNLYKSGKIISYPRLETFQSITTPHIEVTDWKTFNSRLGYTVKYPPDWFASQDPAIVDGDIIYNLQEFYEVRSEENQSNSDLSSLIVIGIEKFKLTQLGLNPPSTPEQVAQAIDGKTV